MIVFYIILISFAISSAVGAAVTNVASGMSCRDRQFTCPDGTCISDVFVCDGQWDCADGSDEVCYSTANLNLTEAGVPHWRSKRQAKCGVYQWRCRDGTCITGDGKCDGKYDCPDKSDETHALCRNDKCQNNWFRCTYGACVDGTAPCNGVVECVDQSDELLSRCSRQKRLINGKFHCLDGNGTILSSYACDGVPNCSDGSDETIAACAEQTCPSHLFQCAYGACVDRGSDCNGKNDCADGSDEEAELCNRVGTVDDGLTVDTPAKSGYCLLPPYPDHGSYVVTKSPQSKPGQSLMFAKLNITCDEGYRVTGNTLAYCENGEFDPLPKCTRYCKVVPHHSVKYNCLVSDGDGTRPCKDYEPPGTLIQPKCKPNYYTDKLYYMTCDESGTWNRNITCKPECGRVTPTSSTLVFGGREALRGELPWYVAIYHRPTAEKKFMHHICGGSIISNSVVLSAGHCFWDELSGLKDASLFAVATAKLYRQWNHEKDRDVQKSNITSIFTPENYFGARANQQQDIAILILETPFLYKTYIRPVCLDFGADFNGRQLVEGNLGKVAGFGLITADDKRGSPNLKVVEMPYVPIRRCQEVTPHTFTENITGDKICAGYSNGTAALCKGDSGGGLAFPWLEREATRYYLRGIVSTSPQVESQCNTKTVITFTSIINHERFINKHL